jgi:hypothetical protein
MKKVIYKYSITSTITTLFLPVGAKILTLQMQHGVPFIWIERTEEAIELKERKIKKVGTGESFNADSNHSYIGTIQEGPYVWHYYEVV